MVRSRTASGSSSTCLTAARCSATPVYFPATQKQRSDRIPIPLSCPERFDNFIARCQLRKAPAYVVDIGQMTYAREELVAELGAVLLGDQLEIGSAMENHAAYLRHWIELLMENPQVLFQVLGEARQAVELIAPGAAEC
jgi:hypothetical protein